MTTSTAAPVRFGYTPALKRRRFIADSVAEQFSRGITPEKIALSLAVGSLCAFFPVPGAATPLCLVAAAALRLNQPIVQMVNWGTAPLYLPLFYAFIRLGDFLLGKARPRLDPALIYHQFGSIALHALLGWAVLAPLWVLGGYFVSRPVLRAVAAARRIAKS